MSELKVIEVEREGTIETFTLLNEEKIKCTIILDNEKHNQTFRYLMDVDRQMLFLECKDLKEGVGK